MKNLIRGNLYQLKKDNFFFGMSCAQLCLLVCIHAAFFFADSRTKSCHGHPGAV